MEQLEAVSSSWHFKFTTKGCIGWLENPFFYYGHSWIDVIYLFFPFARTIYYLKTMFINSIVHTLNHGVWLIEIELYCISLFEVVCVFFYYFFFTYQVIIHEY